MGKGDAALANALGANSAGIGLHTQSITLMRDTLYHICEQAHNKTLGDGDVVQLLQRSQDMTLGVLAIEQLTGAVVARQAMITVGANASVSTNINNTQAALDQAVKNEAMKQTALTQANDAQKKQQDLVDQTKKDLDAATAKAKPIQDAIDKLTTAQKTLQDQVKKDETAVQQAQTTKTKHQDQLDGVTNDIEMAKKKVSPNQAEIAKLIAAQKTLQDQVKKDETAVQQAQATKTNDQTLLDTATNNIETAKKNPDFVAFDTLKQTICNTKRSTHKTSRCRQDCEK